MTYGGRTPRGKAASKRGRLSPEATIKFDVTVRRQGEIAVHSEEFPKEWTIEEILKSMFNGDHASVIAKDELKEIHHVGYPDPYACAGDMTAEPGLGLADGKCGRRVEYLVDGKHMCLPHMRAEIAKGTAPCIMPSASSGMIDMKPSDTVKYPTTAREDIDEDFRE